MEEARKETWRQTLKQKPWRNTADLIAPPWLAQPGTQACLARGGPAHSRLGHPTSVINQENGLQPTGQSERGNFSVDVHSSQITLACVKLTKNRKRMGAPTSAAAHSKQNTPDKWSNPLWSLNLSLIYSTKYCALLPCWETVTQIL